MLKSFATGSNSEVWSILSVNVLLRECPRSTLESKRIRGLDRVSRRT